MAINGIFDQIERLSSIIDNEDLIEGRFENDANGNPIYVGYCVIPNGSTSQKIWYIVKVEYSAGAVVRKILPNLGLGFIYSWDLRSSYFL